MNEHIQRGNEAMRIGDIEAAKDEFYLALDDPDWHFPHERQNFIDLYVANLDVADLFSYDALTFLTGQHQECEDGSVIHTRNTLDVRNAIAFEQE
jgi:hypothetical protein